MFMAVTSYDERGREKTVFINPHYIVQVERVADPDAYGKTRMQVSTGDWIQVEDSFEELGLIPNEMGICE